MIRLAVELPVGATPSVSHMTSANTPTDHTQEPAAEFTDPEFDAVHLSISVADAVDLIHETVRGLHATPTEVGVKIRTTDGLLAAVVADPGAETDAAAAVVHHRTDPASELVTRKATKLKRALTQYRLQSESAAST